MNQREIPLMKEFLAQYRNERVRLFRRQIFDRTVADIHTGRRFQVKAGLEGQADVYGFVKMRHLVRGAGGKILGYVAGDKYFACPFEVEFKGAKTKTSDAQVNWKKFCQEWEIPHIILRGLQEEEPKETIERWNAEFDSFMIVIAGK